MKEFDYDKIRELVECELDKISKKEELTKESLPVLNTLIDIVKDIEEIKSSDNYGYSQRRPMYYNGNSYGKFYNGWMYDDNDHSYRGGRYSRTDSKEHMMAQFENLMDEANPQERDVIRQAMDKLANM